MHSFAPGRLAVGLLLVLASAIAASAIAWGQTTSSSNSGNPTQYVVSVTRTSPAPQPQNPFSGSVPAGKVTPGVLPLSLKDVINRGLKQNLVGLLLASEGIPSARGRWWKGLSGLLPNVTTSTALSAQQRTLRVEGEGIDLSGLREVGVNVSPIIGPFGVFDTRAYLTQSVFNWKSIQQTRSDAQQNRAAQYSYKDARESSLYSCSVSKVELGRAIGNAETGVQEYRKGK